jgi:hypothetical protein
MVSGDPPDEEAVREDESDNGDDQGCRRLPDSKAARTAPPGKSRPLLTEMPPVLRGI